MLVTPDWVRLMARYSAWQNGAQIRLVRTLREEELTRDRGAFWGSILGTLNHLLWGDRIWLHRLAGLPRPELGLDGSARFAPDISVWSEEREGRMPTFPPGPKRSRFRTWKGTSPGTPRPPDGPCPSRAPCW